MVLDSPSSLSTISRQPHITNATAESLNDIFQTIKRKARVFRTLRCLRTMTYLVAGYLDLQITRAFPA